MFAIQFGGMGKKVRARIFSLALSGKSIFRFVLLGLSCWYSRTQPASYLLRQPPIVQPSRWYSCADNGIYFRDLGCSCVAKQELLDQATVPLTLKLIRRQDIKCVSKRPAHVLIWKALFELFC